MSRLMILKLSKKEIVACDTAPLMKTISLQAGENRKGLSDLMGTVGFQVEGFDKDDREPWDIPEVQRYFQKLHQQMPQFPYFLPTEKSATSWQKLYFRILLEGDLGNGLQMAEVLSVTGRGIVSFCDAVAKQTGTQIDAMELVRYIFEAVTNRTLNRDQVTEILKFNAKR